MFCLIPGSMYLNLVDVLLKIIPIPQTLLGLTCSITKYKIFKNLKYVWWYLAALGFIQKNISEKVTPRIYKIQTEKICDIVFYNKTTELINVPAVFIYFIIFFSSHKNNHINRKFTEDLQKAYHLVIKPSRKLTCY